MSKSQFSSLGVPWRTAVKSGASNCVQIARLGAVIMISDSKHSDGPVLCYTRQEWDAFLDGAKKGRVRRYSRPLIPLIPRLIRRSHTCRLADKLWTSQRPLACQIPNEGMRSCQARRSHKSSGGRSSERFLSRLTESRRDSAGRVRNNCSTGDTLGPLR